MIEIRFHGRGGQGAVIGSKVLATAIFSEGKYVQSFPAFGVERRGAPVTAFLRVDGTPINLYDDVGLEADTEDLPIEAEWDERGARCVDHLRVPAAGTPPCMSRLRRKDCGSLKHFGHGTLLMNESSNGGNGGNGVRP